MRIGRITIRWTKDIEKELRTAAIHEQVQSRQIALLMVEIVHLKAVLSRWGIEQGLSKGGASGKVKTPKAGVGSL